MTTKKDQIIKKIQLLKQKTVANGCSEAEALSAAEKIASLLNDYDLSMTEVEIKSQSFIKEDILVNGQVKKPIHDLVSAIGVFTDTKVWYEKKNKHFTYHFFGSENDVQFAHYLFVYWLILWILNIQNSKKLLNIKQLVEEKLDQTFIKVWLQD